MLRNGDDKKSENDKVKPFKRIAKGNCDDGPPILVRRFSG